MKALQVESLFASFDRLQKLYGNKNLSSIYGAGCIHNPKLFLIFINPTARNVSASFDWEGIRAPWLGTKHVWKIFYDLGFISKNLFRVTQIYKVHEWDKDFANNLYTDLADNKVYVTNFAKCTQTDAKPLSNFVLKKYFKLLLREISQVNPFKIISFGNQVSSLLLDKPVRVANYDGRKEEFLDYGDVKVKVYPVYYPVGQGMRNMEKAIKIIKRIKHSKDI